MRTNAQFYQTIWKLKRNIEYEQATSHFQLSTVSQSNMNSVVAAFNCATEIDFGWSCKPIIVFAQIFGINLLPDNCSQSLLRKRLAKFYFLCSFLLLSSLNCYNLYALFTNPVLDQTIFHKSVGSELRNFFEKLNATLPPIGIQFIFLVFPNKNKDSFWKLLKQIETDFGFGKRIYRRLRVISIAAVAACVIWVKFNLTFKYIKPIYILNRLLSSMP